MLEEVLIILLLTILFTISTIFAYLVRRTMHGGCGQSMYLIWLAVMLAAVIPLQEGLLQQALHSHAHPAGSACQNRESWSFDG